jgi:hypothetical protein
MPVTLAQAKVGMADKVEQLVIDEFRRDSFLLDRLVFDDAVSPGTGGSTMTYGYTRLLTPSMAQGRKLNEEYKPGEALREKATADIKIFGGSFQVDRVLEDTAAKSEIAFQLQEKTKAAANKFHYDVINGDAIVNDTDFDGLDKLVSGSSTEHAVKGYAQTQDTDIVEGKEYYTKSGDAYSKVATPAKADIATYYELADQAIDLSDTQAITANAKKFAFAFDTWLASFDGKPDMLLMNRRMKTIMGAIARELKYYTQSEDAFGRKVDNYDGIPMVDLGEYYDGKKTIPCVPIGETTGETSVYGVKLGLDGLHAISPKGGKVVNTYLPDMKAPGAVKTGEVEMLAGLVLKNSKKAGAFRKIKVM